MACHDAARLTLRPCYCTCRLFLSGGLSGAVSRTLTSPLERIKLLYQVQVHSSGLQDFSPALRTSRAPVKALQGLLRTQQIVCDPGHCSGDNTFGTPCLQYHSADSKQDLQACLKALQNTTMQQSLQLCIEVILVLMASCNSINLISACCREEGVRAFWRGNGTNVIRIFPYSAVQFSTNDGCKRIMASKVHNPIFPSAVQLTRMSHSIPFW